MFLALALNYRLETARRNLYPTSPRHRPQSEPSRIQQCPRLQHLDAFRLLSRMPIFAPHEPGVVLEHFAIHVIVQQPCPVHLLQRRAIVKARGGQHKRHVVLDGAGLAERAQKGGFHVRDQRHVCLGDTQEHRGDGE